MCDPRTPAVLRWLKWRRGQHDWPKGASQEELEVAQLFDPTDMRSRTLKSLSMVDDSSLMDAWLAAFARQEKDTDDGDYVRNCCLECGGYMDYAWYWHKCGCRLGTLLRNVGFNVRWYRKPDYDEVDEDNPEAYE